ncbi:MAG TPA: TolC family protein [Proteiniphilum sp.]|nr:TolC family protein [Proteiniphilum sp.]HPJ50306.1 TolC family protein [Proteiniphilum sp.]HPR19007.1 TolC family protein [Proteiniphilum sp.]
MKPYNLFGVILVVLGFMGPHPVAAQTPDSLDRYLETAAKNNPGLNADFLAYKASLEKVPQAGAWPDPQLDIGFFLKPMDIVGGRQVADFTLMQMFPWFGTKKAAQTEATHMAKMAYARFTETRDNLYLEVYTQWYLLSTLVQQLRNNRENLQLLKQLEELALRKVSSSSSGMSSGMGSTAPGMSDVLRVQLEMAEIENNIESILSEIAAEKAKFNALLNRSADREVILPDSIAKVPFFFDEGVTMSEIENRNPMLDMLVEEEQAYRAKGEMDQKMSYPMFGIGLQYMLIGESATAQMEQGMEPEMTGMDMIMPMVSISIPLYRNKYKAQQRESRFLWQSAREKYRNTLNMLQSDLFRLKHQLDDAERKITLYRKQEQMAWTTYQLVVQEFISAKSDLTNVIQVQRQLLDYQLREAEAIAEYNTRVASIRKLRSFNTSNN